MNNDSMRLNNRPKSMNADGIKANYKPMRAFCELIKNSIG